MLDQLFDRGLWDEEDEQDTETKLDITTEKRHDIAIIGVGVKLPTGESIDDFGPCLITELIVCVNCLFGERRSSISIFCTRKGHWIE